MILYIPEFNDATLTHVSTQWFILNTADKLDLITNLVHGSGVTTVNKFSYITNIIVPKNATYYAYAKRLLSDGSTLETNVAPFTFNDVEVLIPNAINLRVEEPLVTITSNTLDGGGTLVLQSTVIRPIGNTLRNVVWSVYNEYGTVLGFFEETTYTKTISASDLIEYKYGMNLRVTCTHIANSGVGGPVSFTEVSSSVVNPILTNRLNHIDPTLDYTLVFDTAPLYVEYVDDNGKVTTISNNIITKDTLQYGTTYKINIFALHTGVTVNSASYITTLPYREVYDIDESFVYGGGFRTEPKLRSYIVDSNEMLFNGKIVDVKDSASIKVINASDINTATDFTTMSLAPNSFDVNNNIKVVSLDNTRVASVDNDRIKVFLHLPSFDSAQIIHDVPHTFVGNSFTYRYNSNEFYYASGGYLRKIDFTTGTETQLVQLPVTNNSYVYPVYIGNDRILIYGSLSTAVIYDIKSNGVNIVDAVDASFVNVELQAYLRLDGKPLFINKTTGATKTYDIHTDTFSSWTTFHTPMESILRKRDGEFVVFSTTDVYYYN